MSRRHETPVVLCIDVEPDPRAFEPGAPVAWDGLERLITRLPALRARLSEATGNPAAFTWSLRMDPQVQAAHGSAAWVAERYGDAFNELAEAGDEIGLHTHVWRWDPEHGEWIADFEDPAWGEHCVEMALDAYETSFGRRCPSHRGGDRFLSGAMLSVLEKRGVAIDLTVEPGWPAYELSEYSDDETSRGRTPDYRRVPGRPYRSTPSSFPAPDPAAESGPLLVPLMSVRRKRPPFRRVPLPSWETPRSKGWRWSHIRKSAIPAVAVRTNFVLEDELWSTIEANCDRLAQYPGTAFKTASAAVESPDLGLCI